MKNEEKQLLTKDLCARLPYNVKIEANMCPRTLFPMDVAAENLPKPYLRPLASMTEEEAIELCTGVHDKVLRITENNYTSILSIDQIDWLNSRHFDYRGLIDMGLALEAPEGMYNGFQRVGIHNNKNQEAC